MADESLAALILEATRLEIKLTFEAGGSDGRPCLNVDARKVDAATGSVESSRKVISLEQPPDLVESILCLSLRSVIREIEGGRIEEPK